MRVGQSFFGNSRENTDAPWSAPNTLSLSALNSWVAEEFRPTGAEFSWHNSYREDANVEVAVGALVGNDTSGAQLAWRGFALQQRRAVHGKSLATAPRRSLVTRRLSRSAAVSDTALWLGSGRPCRVHRAHAVASQCKLALATTPCDNRGDRLLRGDQYAWRARFFMFGLEYQNEEPLTRATEQGQLTERLSFNAHGQRRSTAQTGWSLLDALQAAKFNTTRQGYTGHEQLDSVGLIHMGARLYDPEIGRFIQADDMVEPEVTQGLNRYSYVLNNPLTMTDPTGNLSLRQALGVVIGVVAAIISQQYWAIDKFISFAVATAGGFASAADEN